ncbi:MAG TPA: ABC transporter ATP-binding protein [Chloroflexota bacterium]|jgi:simple sugar transport system ATP-binding protein
MTPPPAADTHAPEPPESAPPSPPLLEARGITKRFGAILANDGVDFTLHAGEVHALVGENGAGKTTLMNVCYGLECPDAGTLLVRGVPVALRQPADALRLGIGMVHQHFMLVPVFTVLENVVLGVEPSGPLGALDRPAARARLRALGERYALPVEPDARVENLAVGQQQRVEILKALYREARILILDEPTAVLTPQEVADLFAVLRGLAQSGAGIVFITHKLDEALAVADRITVLRRGRVVATVRPAETDAPRLAALMVGRAVALTPTKPPAQPGEPVLRVEGLRVRDARGLLAVDDVSFAVRAGEVLGIAGVQGNGQTELVEALAGLRPRAGGAVAWPGVRAVHPGPRAVRAGGTAHVPEDRQRDGLVLAFSVADNLVLCAYDAAPFARWGQRDAAAIAAHARTLMAAFDVRAPSERTPVARLSGGNQQKVILARELSGAVRLVLANQPTRGLDVGSVEAIHQRLLALRDQGCAVLLVSADLDELRALADRIAVLYRGRLVATLPAAAATPEQLGLLMTGATAASPQQGVG